MFQAQTDVQTRFQHFERDLPRLHKVESDPSVQQIAIVQPFVYVRSKPDWG